MIRAILEGRKTQTRRVLKPVSEVPEVVCWVPEPGNCSYARDGWWTARVPGPSSGNWVTGAARCPYGVPGDRLWVRETWTAEEVPTGGVLVAYRASCEGDCFDYLSGSEAVRMRVKRWKPSIFMPRAVSRLTLEITDVRVQRLQDIDNEDSRTEGVECCPHRGATCGFFETGFNQCYGCAYRLLWNQINGPRGFGWDSNPWVWAITFKRVA